MGMSAGETRVLLFRSLATMQSAGISLQRGLRVMGEQSDLPELSTLSQQLGQALAGGNRLSQALKSRPDVFSRLTIGMITVAETTGALNRALDVVAGYEERSRRLATQLRSNLIYPSFLALACVIVTVLMPPLLFEPLFEFIGQSGVEPPFLAVVVMRVSGWLRSPLLYLALAVGLVAGVRWMRDAENRTRLVFALARLPIVGTFLHKLAAQRFISALATQLLAGVSIMLALEQAARAIDHPRAEEVMRRSTDAMRSGASLVQALEETRFFPPFVLHMATAGAEVGRIGDMLQRAAQQLEQDLEYQLAALNAALEPLVLLFMGGVVAVVVVTPMLSIVQVLNRL